MNAKKSFFLLITLVQEGLDGSVGYVNRKV